MLYGTQLFCLFFGIHYLPETNIRDINKINSNYIDARTNTDSKCENTSFKSVEVIRIVDGDTLVVNNEGIDEKVRIIGINTPESVSNDSDENCIEGELASDYIKSIVTPGMVVYMEYDQKKEDQYGRTLSYIWLNNEVDTKSFDDFCTYNLGAIILRNTYCEAAYYSPNGKYKDWYEEIERCK